MVPLSLFTRIALIRLYRWLFVRFFIRSYISRSGVVTRRFSRSQRSDKKGAEDGHVNGHTNGHANGHVNGYANGKVNGVANGKA